MTDEEIKAYVDSRINTLMSGMTDIGNLPEGQMTEGTSLPFVQDGQLVQVPVGALTDRRWQSVTEVPAVLGALAERARYVESVELKDGALTVGTVGADGEPTSQAMAFARINGTPVAKAGGTPQDISMPTVQLSPVYKAETLNFAAYTDLQLGSAKITWNGREYAQIQLVKSSGGDPVPTRLWAWGDFVIKDGQLLNFSTGSRSLLLMRDTADHASATASWSNLDRFVFSRNSGESLTLESPTGSSYVKLATSGMKDTLAMEGWTSGNLVSDAHYSAITALSVPRSCYIASVEFREQTQARLYIKSGDYSGQSEKLVAILAIIV